MTSLPSTILIIDDEPQLRTSLALVLENAGYRVMVAADGQEALKLLQASLVDLVFLEIRLPDQNGMDLLPQIRKLCPDKPVIIMTAHATIETAIEAVRKGARDYLIKPVDPEDLLERVQKIQDEQVEPVRRREIVDQIQSLISELIQADQAKMSSANGISIPPDTTDRYLTCGHLTLDLHARQVLVSGKRVHIAPSTFDYLVTLGRKTPDPVSYETLVKESQGYKVSRSEAREIAVWHVHELRKVLETNPQEPRLIITVRNIGYRLVPG